jgi:Fe2+ or Zn2+ uptake regulation protein
MAFGRSFVRTSVLGEEGRVPQAVEAAVRETLRRAGLASQGRLPRLLALLQDATDTHLSLSDVVRMAADAGLAATQVDLARHLETLADVGLIGRIPNTGAEAVFDTVPEPHSHMVYEETAQIVDLHVSPETLLAIVRRALAERPEEVEILIRFRRDPFRAMPARNEAARLLIQRDGNVDIDT